MRHVGQRIGQIHIWQRLVSHHANPAD